MRYVDPRRHWAALDAQEEVARLISDGLMPEDAVEVVESGHYREGNEHERAFDDE